MYLAKVYRHISPPPVGFGHGRLLFALFAHRLPSIFRYYRTEAAQMFPCSLRDTASRSLHHVLAKHMVAARDSLRSGSFFHQLSLLRRLYKTLLNSHTGTDYADHHMRILNCSCNLYRFANTLIDAIIDRSESQ